MQVMHATTLVLPCKHICGLLFDILSRNCNMLQNSVLICTWTRFKTLKQTGEYQWLVSEIFLVYTAVETNCCLIKTLYQLYKLFGVERI